MFPTVAIRAVMRRKTIKFSNAFDIRQRISHARGEQKFVACASLTIGELDCKTSSNYGSASSKTRMYRYRFISRKIA